MIQLICATHPTKMIAESMHTGAGEERPTTAAITTALASTVINLAAAVSDKCKHRHLMPAIFSGAYSVEHATVS